MGYSWNWGKAAGGSAAGGLSMGPWGLLLGAASGFQKNPADVNSVLPEISAEKMAADAVRGSTMGQSYSRAIGANTGAANDYIGKLIASGVDPTSAARIAKEREQAGASGIQDKILSAESEMYSSALNQYKPIEMARDDERQSYTNMVNDNKAEGMAGFVSMAPAIIGAAGGNLARGEGLLGGDWATALDGMGVDTGLEQATETGDVVNQRNSVQALLFGKSKKPEEFNIVEALKTGKGLFDDKGEINANATAQMKSLAGLAASLRGASVVPENGDASAAKPAKTTEEKSLYNPDGSIRDDATIFDFMNLFEF